MTTLPLRPQRARLLEIGIDAWGYERLALDQINGLRKTIPGWAPEGTPHHFFKYSDEQTILAARAVDSAVARHGLNMAEQSNWAVITAPQFLGRLQGANVFKRFLNGGAPAVSPHTIPQHSLHSVSGALSVLLATRGPNVGLGGGPNALAEALLAAASLFENAEAPASWLVCTAWDPEPLPDRDGSCTSAPVCHAFALAVRASAEGSACGRLVLDVSDSPLSSSADAANPSVADVVEQLSLMERTMQPQTLQWTFPWGATAALLVAPRVAALPLAA